MDGWMFGESAHFWSLLNFALCVSPQDAIKIGTIRNSKAHLLYILADEYVAFFRLVKSRKRSLCL